MDFQIRSRVRRKAADIHEWRERRWAKREFRPMDWPKPSVRALFVYRQQAQVAVRMKSIARREVRISRLGMGRALADTVILSTLLRRGNAGRRREFKNSTKQYRTWSSGGRRDVT